MKFIVNNSTQKNNFSLIRENYHTSIFGNICGQNGKITPMNLFLKNLLTF